MSNQPEIPDTDDAWETGELGRDERYVAVVNADLESQINEAVGLRAISIRLEEELINDFKLIASLSGLSYQPLMRQALRRFADGEKRRLLVELAEARQKERAEKAAKDSKRKVA